MEIEIDKNKNDKEGEELIIKAINNDNCKLSVESYEIINSKFGEKSVKINGSFPQMLVFY